jgi:hypothetical protein
MRDGPDRASVVQVPLFLLVLAAPAVYQLIRRHSRRVQASGFVLQLLAYAVYETGVSDQTDNRVDLLLIVAAIGLNYWLVLGRNRPDEGSG